VVALRTPGLRAVDVDGQTVALRLLADRRDELGAARTLTVNRMHRLLVELIPGGAKTFLFATQAKALLAGVRPRDVAGKTRRRLAAKLIVELDGIDKKIKAAKSAYGPGRCCRIWRSHDGPPAPFRCGRTGADGTWARVGSQLLTGRG